MASEPIFSNEAWQAMLAPFSTDLPEGADPGMVGTDAQLAFEELKGTRRRTLEDVSSTSDSWHDVARLAELFLQEHAKHFDAALWLCEASARTHGFPGLRDGLALITNLLDAFPARLYPHPDEEDTLADTLGMLHQLIYRSGRNRGTLNPGIINQCLSDGADGLGVTFEMVVKAQDQTVPADKITIPLDKIEQAIRRSRSAFLRDLCDDLTAALGNWETLAQAVARYCGEARYSFDATIRQLSDIRAYVVKLVGEPAPESLVIATITENPTVNETVHNGSRAEIVISHRIRDREAAFRQLLDIAGFFRQTEPHSPIAHSIEEVVRRGRLSFADLVAELIPDEEPRKKFYQGVGIRWSDPK
jgi:type VI secretion system protein ImpA